MKLRVDDELVDICKDILREDRCLEHWRELESDDQFQTTHCVGGFDATEGAFCFSVYRPSETELWVQFTLEEASHIAAGKLMVLDARPAELTHDA
jgi:hypothetical protein